MVQPKKKKGGGAKKEVHMQIKQKFISGKNLTIDDSGKR